MVLEPMEYNKHDAGLEAVERRRKGTSIALPMFSISGDVQSPAHLKSTQQFILLARVAENKLLSFSV